MFNIKLLFTSSFLFLPFITFCSQEDLLKEKIEKAKRANDRLERLATSGTEHAYVAGLKAGGDLFVEWGKKKIELWYDKCPTVTGKINWLESQIKLLNEEADTLAKRINIKEDIINKRIASIRNKGQLNQADQQKINSLVEEKSNQLERALEELSRYDKLHEIYTQELEKLTSETANLQSIASSEKESNESDNSSQEKPNNSSITKENDSDTEKPGFLKKIGSLVIPASVGTINFLAEKCGPKKAAEWLGKNSEFFAGKEALVSGGLTVTGLAVISVALYKVYGALTTDEEAEADDFFAKFNRATQK